MTAPNLVLPHLSAQVMPEVIIDLDVDVIPVDRPEGLNERQLGLLALDMGMLHPDHAEIVEVGREVEASQGVRGFEPNTVHFVWPKAGLSLHGILIVAINHEAWKRSLSHR